MKFIWVWNGKKIKQLSIILIAAFFTAGLLYVERDQLMVFSTSEGPQAFYKADIEEKKIALTFNISWGDNRTLPILDVLKDRDVENTTFFLSGAWAERHPDVVERIVEDGHEVGNHGFQYKDYPGWDDQKIRRDIRTSHDILSEMIDDNPTLLRPPNGNFDKDVLNLADAEGYTIAHWSIDSKDYTNPGVDQIVDNVLQQVDPGEVILMHASDSVKQTHKALPIIIDQLKNEGYEFVTISELIASTDTKTEEID
ncbi:polysaccharide deacetylase family sporulation protein PdaB [Desertibacillus haloalkaliphilus]|uniref:polysaccharide deacetylase family sporulation protein PdaB n=1 Tax=Desertibacillus haloalkaliphilus TaxID=1328930 RepID=UPI001C25F289|nr:polysaccharide deacetylase family sporulation protein PdaB [Desertibacillus haloalkaliphilus]MBU8908573.1 polysaccharide deacetylase family sporulation protein PdaB [Desertibacillus haloalkaliphilus]